MSCLYYIHDPMCSWCWGFSKAWQQLQKSLPQDIEIVRVLGGLAPDTDELMSESMRVRLINTWQRIEQHITGVKFNFDYWNNNEIKRTTYPACRAVIAARQQGSQYDAIMTSAIQRAYYQQARDPSKEATLIELADEIMLNSVKFEQDLHSDRTQQELVDEIQQAHIMHADSFPSIVLEHKGRFWPIAIDYNDAHPMLELITMILRDE